MVQISQRIDNLLQSILEGYGQRFKLQRSLSNCDKADYGQNTDKGKLLNNILSQIESVELEILWNNIELMGEFEVLCNQKNISPKKLDLIKYFKPYKDIEQILVNNKVISKSYFELGCKTYNVLIQPANKERSKSEKPSGLMDIRHVVEFNGNRYDIVALIESLIRLWSLILESNFEYEKHKFVIQSRPIEAVVWANGLFYESVTKSLCSTHNKKLKTNSPELIVIIEDIQNRLKRIGLYYNEKYNAREELRQFCGQDVQKRTDKYEHIKLKLQVTEDNLLHELYHLGDNIKKYLAQNGQSAYFKVLENFEPYRWCGNYVNYRKHGSRGKNRTIAIPGYQIDIFSQIGPKPTDKDNIVDCNFMINIEGRIENAMEIAHRLIDIWFIFLKYHTDIDFTHIKANINSFRKEEFVGKSLYTGNIPDGVLKDAQKQVQERKKLNL